jgi:hypothetical protein
VPDLHGSFIRRNPPRGPSPCYHNEDRIRPRLAVGVCRTHYAANLMAATPKSSWPWVRALLQSVYDQPDATSVHAQFDRVLDAVVGSSRASPSTSTQPALTSSPSPASRSSCGARSGPTIPKSGSTARSADSLRRSTDLLDGEP